MCCKCETDSGKSSKALLCLMSWCSEDYYITWISFGWKILYYFVSINSFIVFWKHPMYRILVYWLMMHVTGYLCFSLRALKNKTSLLLCIVIFTHTCLADVHAYIFWYVINNLFCWLEDALLWKRMNCMIGFWICFHVVVKEITFSILSLIRFVYIFLTLNFNCLPNYSCAVSLRLLL